MKSISLIRLPVFLFCLFLLFHCSGNQPSSDSVFTWGLPGSVPGRFSAPRAIAANKDFVYNIDRTGRVQKFTRNGEFILQWLPEKQEKGTPSGMSLDESGNVWIPDTHNSRVLEYDPNGNLIRRFGEYGEGPGQFIFLTDLTFGEQGEIFTIEYGKHDRVQVFTHEGKYLRQWGDFGAAPDQFNRPMGIVCGKEGNLYIADSVNHRIVVYTQKGERVRIIGKKGTGKGEFAFPYAIDRDENGDLYVCEFGNHRIQKLSPEGKCLGVWGHRGKNVGQLTEPWGVAVSGDWLFIADTQNHRIQRIPVNSLF